MNISLKKRVDAIKPALYIASVAIPQKRICVDFGE